MHLLVSRLSLNTMPRVGPSAAGGTGYGCDILSRRTNHSATNGSGGQANVSISNETLLTVYSDIQLKGETKFYIVYNSYIYMYIL